MLATILLLAHAPAIPHVPEAGAPPWTVGTPEISSIGELAFGPDGVLFLADPLAATVFAVRTEVRAGEAPAYLIEAPDAKVAALLGTTPDQVVLNDIVVHPVSGDLYVSVTRNGSGGARPALVRVDAYGDLEEVLLEGVAYQSQRLADASEGERAESITDLAFHAGRLWVAGLSNEEFASNLRSLAFPFDGDAGGTAVEIYHGNHGAYETRAPVRTFLPFELDGEPHLVAAYTCTPLVTFPVAELKPGSKVRGRTIAELGGGNRPLDMVAYEKEGERYLLLSNSRHGVMRIQTRELASAEAIDQPVGGRGGVGFETIDALEGVVQMTPAGDGMVAVLIEEPSHGSLMLGVVELP